MLRKIEKNAKSVEEALALAAAELGVPVDEVSYQVEREVGKGLMGLLLGKEVIISAWVTKEAEAEEAKQRAAEQKRAAREAAALKAKADAADKADGAELAAAKAKVKEKARVKAAEVQSAQTPNPYAPKIAPVAKDYAAEAAQPAADDAKPKPETGKRNREVTEKALNDATYFANTLIKNMGFADAVVTVKNGGDAVCVDVAGSRMGLLIGKRGDTLDAVQYLTSLYVNKEKNSHIKVNVDTEGYRHKREETLIKLAHGLERRVLRERKSVTLEPMSPNERRIIHAALQNNDKIKTYSIGEEPNRKVVVALNK